MLLFLLFGGNFGELLKLMWDSEITKRQMKIFSQPVFKIVQNIQILNYMLYEI